MQQSLNHFHHRVRDWFERQFKEPTPVQAQAWPFIQNRQNTLLAAPTGSGKTLAAFLIAIDQLLRLKVDGKLGDQTQVLYLSPLKALANDIRLNLQQPLQAIQSDLGKDKPIRAQVRSGDTPASERQKMLKRPPHILATTPESLYILLTSAGGRNLLCGVNTIIVDEIHALADNKRGAHLSLSLERLNQLCLKQQAREPVRIGLSATQKPMSEIARFLVGVDRDCEIVDSGHMRDMDLALAFTDSPLEAVMANEVWVEIYNGLTELIEQQRTTLIFVNTRRLAERVAKHLADRLGTEVVTAHHGSLAKEHRLHAERQLKTGQLRALVATASLELGIDIGDIDLVCQLGSPRSISAFLQRVGRSGHGVGRVPKARLFPLSRDELIESIALIDAVKSGKLDRLTPVHACLDVLAQQTVAEVSAGEWDRNSLLALFKKAWPYRDLNGQTFEKVLSMLADGYATRRGRRGAYLYYDRVNANLRGRKGAALTALSSGGVIPDQFDYEVVLLPCGDFIGSLNEDFAFESLPGDIFQLGNTSYRIAKIEQGKVFVEDAAGQPPNIPFWFGESLGRSDELSLSVSQLRKDVAENLEFGLTQTMQWFAQRYQVSAELAQQCLDYLAKTKAALGVIPNQQQIVAERFFDETGDMHLVIHSTFGSRINRAWGLSLRKCFCRKFNFELQAAALEDSIILSLGPNHSFPLDEVAAYLHPKRVRALLIQALLNVPLFATQWRWNASIALAIKRMYNGKRRPAQWQRNDAEDLVALVFPDQLACLENIQGDREIPEHPLVQQTLQDCLQVRMDITGLEKILTDLKKGDIEWISRDLPQPSPISQEIINARPFAFLDDAPAEERRTLAIQTRHLMDMEDAAQMASLDPQAIKQVQQEAMPVVTGLDESHDAIVLLGYVTEQDSERYGLQAYLTQLSVQSRVIKCIVPEQCAIWVATDRLHELKALFPQMQMQAQIKPLFDPVEPEHAAQEIIRSRLECSGPILIAQLKQSLALTEQTITQALLALEQEGFAVRGQYSTDQEQWCDRRLLARINRYTVKALRKEIQPVSAADFMRFLLHWHQLDERGQGQEALVIALQRLEGFAVPAAAWEKHILPSRIKMYLPHELDKLCTSGLIQWLRLSSGQGKNAAPLRNTPIVLSSRQNRPFWRKQATLNQENLSAKAQKVFSILEGRGALFIDDIVKASSMLQIEVQQALSECAAKGRVSCDDFSGLRELIMPSDKRRQRYKGRRLTAAFSVNTSGRWVALEPLQQQQRPAFRQDDECLMVIAMSLLQRYGVVFRKILERENHIPPWRDLLYILRRMEARGEVRGGRFVEGFSGEQFALPEALSEIRRIRRIPTHNHCCIIAATDPLNLVGIIVPGERVSAYLNSKILLRDGIPLAVQSGKDIQILTTQEQESEGVIRQYFMQAKSNPSKKPNRNLHYAH